MIVDGLQVPINLDASCWTYHESRFPCQIGVSCSTDAHDGRVCLKLYPTGEPCLLNLLAAEEGLDPLICQDIDSGAREGCVRNQVLLRATYGSEDVGDPTRDQHLLFSPHQQHALVGIVAASSYRRGHSRGAAPNDDYVRSSHWSLLLFELIGDWYRQRPDDPSSGCSFVSPETPFRFPRYWKSYSITLASRRYPGSSPSIMSL